jgi:hypothetical protein
MKAIRLGYSLQPGVEHTTYSEIDITIYPIHNPWKNIYILKLNESDKKRIVTISDEVDKYHITIRSEDNYPIYYILVSTNPLRLQVDELDSVELPNMKTEGEEDIYIYKLGDSLYGQGSWISDGFHNHMIEMWWIDVSLPTISILRGWCKDDPLGKMTIHGKEIDLENYEFYGVYFTEAILVISRLKRYKIHYGDIDLTSNKLI